MRISDWSSDVCSSDLPRAGQGIEPILRRAVKEDVPEIRALTFAAYAKWVGVTPRPPRPVTADYDGAFRDHRFDLLVEGGTLVAFRSEEHTSELQSLMRISYAVFCLKKKKTKKTEDHNIAR